MEGWGAMEMRRELKGLTRAWVEKGRGTGRYEIYIKTKPLYIVVGLF